MERPSFVSAASATQAPRAHLHWREMLRGRKLAVLVAIGSVASACARQHSTRFLEARAAAERDYSSGRYEQAAHAWRSAGEAAKHEDDRIEAIYRAASAYERAERNDDARATYLELLRLAPASSRAPRAAYDLALLELRLGEVEQGEARLEGIITRYQASALAGRAFALLMRRLEERRGKAGSLAWLESLTPRVKDRELLEQIRYVRAGLLLALGRPEPARDAYLELARRFPYPQGAYWDDALWHAADIERTEGRPREAIAHLEQMLREVEPAHFQGSYARPRYAEAQFRIAEIYRDDLNQPAVARKQFRKVYRDHPTSLMRDDALWQEAVTAYRSGDPNGACDPLEILVNELPDSRYTACAGLLCDRLARTNGRRSCRPYIQRTLAENHEGSTEWLKAGATASPKTPQSSK